MYTNDILTMFYIYIDPYNTVYLLVDRQLS